MCQLLLDGRHRLARIQVLGTNLAAIHNGVATVELESIVQILQTFLSLAVTRVFNPTVGLHENGRSQVLVGVPTV